LICSPSAKKSGEARKQAGKKEGGLSVIPTRNFYPLALPREAGNAGGKAFPQLLRQPRSRTSSLRGRHAGGNAGRVNRQNPLNFAQKRFGFHPANTTIQKNFLSFLED